MTQTDVADLAADLDDLLTSGPARKYGPSCGAAALLAQLRNDAPQVADSLAALIDSKVPATAIATKLEGRYPIDVQVIRRHRNRSTVSGCRCPR